MANPLVRAASTVCPAGVNNRKLHDELDASEAIAPAVLGVTLNESADELILRFSADLSGAEETAADAICAAHDPTTSPLRLLAYVPEDVSDHRVVDYKAGLTTSLHKVVESMFRGEVRDVRYYDMASVVANPNNPELWTEVLRVSVTYNRDAMGLAQDRQTVRTWKLEDGTDHPVTKVTSKKYDPFYQMKEGNRRRQNVIEDVSLKVLGLLAGTETAGDLAAAEVLGRTFTSLYNTELSNFVRVGSNEMELAIDADTTTTWLNNNVEAFGYPVGTTIRHVIKGEVKDIVAAPEAWQ